MFSVTAHLFAQALTLTVADSSELRARLDTNEEAPASSVPGETAEDEGAQIHYDAMTQPSVMLAVDTKRAAYSLSYSPTFTTLSFEDEQARQNSIFHNVYLNASTDFKRTSVSLSQSFTYGSTNYRLAFAPVSAAEPVPEPGSVPEPDPLAPDERLPGQEFTLDQELKTGSSATTLSLNHELSPTLGLSEYVSYTYSTGFGESQDVYPKQQGGTVGASVSQELSERDTLSTTLDAGVYYTDPLVTSETGEIRRSILGVLRENWNREWLRDLEVMLGIGLIYLRTDEGDQTTESLLLDLLPVGTTTIDYTWGYAGARYTATFSLGTAPYVDRFTGVVDPRVFWSASLERRKRRLTLTATVAGAQSTNSDAAEDVGAPDAVRAVSAQTSASATFLATYEAVDRLELRAGITASLNELLSTDDLVPGDEATDQAVNDGLLYFAFVGFTYSFDPLKY